MTKHLIVIKLGWILIAAQQNTCYNIKGVCIWQEKQQG